MNCVKGHTKQINDIQPSKDGSWFITASKDFTAKVKMSPTYPPKNKTPKSIDDNKEFSHWNDAVCLVLYNVCQESHALPFNSSIN